MEGSPREKLPPEVFDYYSGGAWDLQTLHENQVLSSLSTCRLEDVAAAASGPLWFQETLEMLRRPFFPFHEVKRFLSKPFLATDQNARRRQLCTADQDVEAFQRWKLDRERIVVEKAAQNAESPGSYTLRKVLLTGHHLY
jgi:hypothetical protein